MMHKLEMYCYNDEDFAKLVQLVQTTINGNTDYELIELQEHGETIVKHHHLDFKKRDDNEGKQ